MNKNKYFEDGFEVFDYLSSDDYKFLKEYVIEWILNLFKSNGLQLINSISIENYHLNLNIDEKIHTKVLNAKNRHQLPNDDIHNLLINSRLRNFLSKHNINGFNLWDEGLGWLAFRLIRPGFGDGYPLSKKDWGPGKGTISVWIPILGFESDQMIGFIPGSNNREYESFLPISSKFTPHELRLKTPISESDIFRPKLQPGQAILFSPKTIHTEDVTNASATRLSLEFRITPFF